jgi:hypothetical protein
MLLAGGCSADFGIRARTRNVIQCRAPWQRRPAVAVPAMAVLAAAVPAASLPRRSFRKSVSLTPAVDTLTHGAKLLNLRDSRAIATP